MPMNARERRAEARVNEVKFVRFCQSGWACSVKNSHRNRQVNFWGRSIRENALQSPVPMSAFIFLRFAHNETCSAATSLIRMRSRSLDASLWSSNLSPCDVAHCHSIRWRPVVSRHGPWSRPAASLTIYCQSMAVACGTDVCLLATEFNPYRRWTGKYCFNISVRV